MRISLATCLVLLAVPAGATTITYNNFASTAGLSVNGNAAAVTDASGRSVLRLTPAATNQAGSAFTSSTVTLGADASFSEAFGFNINQAGGSGGGADGLVFVVQTVSSNVGSNGQGIGYSGITNSVGVKFDTYQNSGDLSANFVGVVLGGNINAVSSAASPYNLKGGTDLYGFVDYNGATKDLQVRLSNTTARPSAALIDYTVDLVAQLNSSNAYVGFTSGTGGGYANHDILNTQFVNSYNPVNVPEPVSIALLGVALAMGVGARRQVRAARSLTHTGQRRTGPSQNWGSGGGRHSRTWIDPAP